MEDTSEPISFQLAAFNCKHLIRTGEGNRSICISWAREKSSQSNVKTHKEQMRVYDIINAGKYHRFTVSGRLVHNCGYGGSTGALKAFGALENGMKEEELQPMVDAWRNANSKIVQLWYDVERIIKKLLTPDCEYTKAKSHGLIITRPEEKKLFITLPSGRRLSYINPRVGKNRFGSESIEYDGIDATKHWGIVETFGGKIIENCCAENTLVITDKGLIHIQDVTTDMKVWDGEEWVQHDGVICRGEQEIIKYGGLSTTPEHNIYIDDNAIPMTEVSSHFLRITPCRTPYEICGSRYIHYGNIVYDILNAGPRHRFAVWAMINLR